ncbi:ATP-grasp domain-containing protein [Achromobacter aloeverae]|uniref:Carbamoyl-phosphate synthase large subunit n=1 Tax=Achromobacter aloeverae TaxID=1750518 RepID=A0A4V1MSM8_9BURK|nr:ATP-grasp domain-containing protein [Achromobacter aloeverae]RXN92590.1 carbamoyl-phosphate synthase large subunit [Achromobacter aloeverae]
MKKVRVLVFPCGSENAAEVHQALRYSVHVEILGASSVEDHGRFRFDNYIGGVPNIADPSFDQAFHRIIIENRIDLVFATHDSVLNHLAPRAKCMGFFLVNGDPEAAAVARSKRRTYALFSGLDWAPATWASPEDVPQWPVVIKPDEGQGGQGVSLVHDLGQARAVLAQGPDNLIVEYLPGAELTVDCFSDADGALVWVGPRTRERVRAGISMRCQLWPESSPEISAIAGEINGRLRLRGPWFFQLKADSLGRWKLLEICCRIAGSMVAQRARGVNLPLMAVQDYLGRKLAALPSGAVSVVDRNIATRAALDVEFDTVFVDLDDTLVMNGHAVPIVLAFLHQCVAQGKRIKLITRHAAIVGETLAAAHIAPTLFDEIIHLRNGEPKGDYVSPRSIFIDNYFPDRLDVARKTGVPVLDVDAVEFFLR